MDTDTRRAVSVGALTVIVSSVSGSVFAAPHIENALALPVGILFGIPGIAGFVAGVVVHEVFTLGPEIGIVARVVGDTIVVAGGYVLWGERPVPAIGDGRRELLTGVTWYLLVGSVALLLAVGVEATGVMLVGQAPFFVAVTLALSEWALPTLLLGPFVLVGLATVGHWESPSARTGTVRTSRLAGACLVLGLWVGAGSVLSGVRQDVAARPGFTEEAVLHVVPPVLESVVAFSVGRGYHVTHLLVASLAVFTVTALVLGVDTSGISYDLSEALYDASEATHDTSEIPHDASETSYDPSEASHLDASDRVERR